MYILERVDLEYFERGKAENLNFWTNLNGEPDFTGKKILDIGCGHGSLCVYLASKGAKQVIGIDTDQRHIDFARNNVLINYPQFKKSVNYICCEISQLEEYEFDIIVSKDTFEHIMNLSMVLDQINYKLKLQGKAYIGIGPLYNSPYGDHGRTKAILPWGHLIFPESFLLKRINRHRNVNIKSIYELGLNKYSLADYRKRFYKSKLTVLLFQVNASHSFKSRLFSSLRYISLLEEYISHNLYCILQKTEDLKKQNKISKSVRTL